MVKHAHDYNNIILDNLNSNNIIKRIQSDKQFVFKSETSVALYLKQILNIFNNYIIF